MMHEEIRYIAQMRSKKLHANGKTRRVTVRHVIREMIAESLQRLRTAL